MFNTFVAPTDMPSADVTKLQDYIVKYFSFRELGAETPARFEWYFQSLVEEHNQEYNRLYKALLTELEPFANVILDHTNTRTYNTQEDTQSQRDIHDVRDVDETGSKDASTDHTISDEAKSQNTPFTQVLSPSTSYMSQYTENQSNDDITMDEDSTRNLDEDLKRDDDFAGQKKMTGTITDRQVDKDLSGMTEAEAFDIYMKKRITIDNLWLSWLEPAFMQIFD